MNVITFAAVLVGVYILYKNVDFKKKKTSHDNTPIGNLFQSVQIENNQVYLLSMINPSKNYNDNIYLMADYLNCFIRYQDNTFKQYNFERIIRACPSQCLWLAYYV